MHGKGSTTELLEDAAAAELLAAACADLPLDGKRVLVLIPHGTRNPPIPPFFRLLDEVLGKRVIRLDYLIALGPHPPMSDTAIDKLVGVSAAERATRYPNVRIFNHAWDRSDALQTIGSVPRSEVAQLTGGLLAQDIQVTLNRRILDYAHLVICGTVFPHEGVGF